MVPIETNSKKAPKLLQVQYASQIGEWRGKVGIQNAWRPEADKQARGVVSSAQCRAGSVTRQLSRGSTEEGVATTTGIKTEFTYRANFVGVRRGKGRVRKEIKY